MTVAAATTATEAVTVAEGGTTGTVVTTAARLLPGRVALEGVSSGPGLRAGT